MLNVLQGRRRPNLLIRTLAAIGTVLLASCGGDAPSEQSRIAIEVSSYAFVVSPTAQNVLTATVTGTDINAPIHWTTSAPSVATVTDDGPFGVVTGVAEGTATIYATLAAKPSIRSQPVTVTVARVPALVSFSVDTTLQQLVVGDSKTIALRPVLATPQATVSYTFSSANTAVASVNPTTGVVTAQGPGAASITVTATATGVGLINTSLSATAPFRVAAISPHVRSNIAAGRFSTCALKLSGEAFCWGWNVKGQLGDGTTADRSTPTAVLGGLSFSEIAGGYWHTCGISNDNKAYCWGAGGNGRLGTGDTVTRRVPTAVAGGMSFLAIDAGGVHTCGVNTSNLLYCWGYNRDFELGDLTAQEKLLPNPVVAPGKTFSAVALGHEQSCALGTDAVMYCFYSNGVLPEAGGATVRQAGTGGFGRCLISARGQVACWSANVPRTDPHPFYEGIVFRSIAQSDYNFACGISVNDDAYCWGYGENGQLGDGTSNGRLTPAPVSGGLKFKELALGEAHVCGITLTDAIYCWGSNSNGQLGVIGGTSRVPQLVPFTR